MKASKFLIFIIAVVSVIVLPVVLLLTDVQLVAFDRGYYEKEYMKYNIPNNVGISMEELKSSTEKLLLYLEDRRDNIDFKAVVKNQETEFFTERDKIHMVDVKNLFVKGRVIRNFGASLLLAFLLLFLFYRKRNAGILANIGIASFIAGIVPVILIIVLMNIDFYKYFTVFHEIFFTNDFWLLDPAVDRLVNIFPQEFFSDMAFRIAYLYMAELAAVFTAGILYRKRMRKI